MSLVIAALVVLVVVLYLRRKGEADVVSGSTPALDAWVRNALEQELAEGVLGLRGSTTEERRRLAQTLANEPDADIVSKIEDKVRSVELEFVRYAHDAEVEATLRVRYATGEAAAASRRLALGDLPTDVIRDFEAKKSTRVFRAWTFPWQQVQAL